MKSITIDYSSKRRAYHGPELRPHFLLSEMGLRGSAIGAFQGPCSVKTEHLVDWEDRLAHDRIEAKEMLHFLGEFFGVSLREGVYLQRLFMAIVEEKLAEILKGKAVELKLRRDGDDIFLSERKLSVSIVTASPVSVLLHVGLNIDPAGAPVPAIGLSELRVEADQFANEVLGAFSAEWESIEWACAKVRPVV